MSMSPLCGHGVPPASLRFLGVCRRLRLSRSSCCLHERGRAHQAAHAHRLDGRARHEHQRALFLEAFVEHVHRAQMERRRVVLIRLARPSRSSCAISTSAWPRITRACFSRVACASRDIASWSDAGNDDVAHLDRLHGHAPRIRARVDELLQLLLDPLAAAQQVGERRAADDVAQRGLRRPAHRVAVVSALRARPSPGRAPSRTAPRRR